MLFLRNDFFIKGLVGSQAVLENFHVSVAFRTMLFYPNGAANILEQLNAEQYKVRMSLLFIWEIPL